MPKKIYRVTKDPKWFEEAIAISKHLFVKSSDGTIRCEVHDGDATFCATRLEGPIVYENTLDGGTYELKVVRLEPYRGLLTLQRADNVVLEKNVGISYDAPFGPDAEDVEAWNHIGIEAADVDYRKRGETPP